MSFNVCGCGERVVDGQAHCLRCVWHGNKVGIRCECCRCRPAAATNAVVHPGNCSCKLCCTSRLEASLPTAAGRKEDTQKPRYTLLPWRSLEELVRVLEVGARKYAPENWRQVEDGRRRYLDAALRHLAAVLRGEDKDDESGERHLAHAAVSLLFVMELEGKR